MHVAPQYKTKKCRSFFENGFCPYGSRCQFLHSEAITYFLNIHNLYRKTRKLSYSEEIGLLEKYDSPEKPPIEAIPTEQYFCSRNNNKI